MSNDTQTPETTALATTEGAALAPAGLSEMEQRKALAARLPASYRGSLLFKERPTPEGMFGMIEKLPEDTQTAMMKLVRKTRPQKQGVHTQKQGFAPTVIRVYQGTGNDPLRPAKMTPGEFYTAESKVLGEQFVGVVFHVFEGRTMWPGKDDNQKQPICYSLDRVTGSKHGPCATCHFANKAYNAGGCAKDVTVTLVDREMTGIYQITFAKSSFGSGDALLKVLNKGENIWDRWVTFQVEARTDKDRKWYVIKATPVNDAKKPENNLVPPALHELLEGFSRLVDLDVYYPQLADNYDRAKAALSGGAPEGVVGETYQEQELVGNDAGKGGDYSKDI